MHTPHPGTGLKRGQRASAGLALTACVLGLWACTTTSKPKTASGGPDLGGAVAQPLQDFNLQKVEIPHVLRSAIAEPYKPAPRDCAGIAREVVALDAVLGVDLDRDPVEPDHVGEFMEGAVRDFATSWIPFRSIVRGASGAAAHSRKAELAIVAGGIRRGYLKGAGERAGCKPPAAPLRAPVATRPPEAMRK